MGPKGPNGLLSSLRMPISIFIPSFIDLVYIRDLKIPPFLRSSLAPRRMGASRRDERSEYCVLASPNVPRRWPNTILDHLAPVIKIIFITSIGLVY